VTGAAARPMTFRQGLDYDEQESWSAALTWVDGAYRPRLGHRRLFDGSTSWMIAGEWDAHCEDRYATSVGITQRPGERPVVDVAISWTRVRSACSAPR
jgi:hypothetical protein